MAAVTDKTEDSLYEKIITENFNDKPELKELEIDDDYKDDIDDDINEEELTGSALAYKSSNTSFSNYMLSFNRCEMLSREEVVDCFKEMEKHPEKKKELTEKIILSNIRLVISIAKKYIGGTQSNEMDDLCQMGIFGLYRAIETFDYKKGFAFSTYATNWIRQYIIRNVIDTDLMIRLPVHIREKDLYVKKTASELFNTLHRMPTIDEVYEKVKVKYPAMNIEDIEYIQLMNSTTSTDLLVGESESGAESYLSDFIVDTKSNPESEVITKINKDWIWEQVEDILLPREADIIKMRMGYNGNSPMTLNEISNKYGLSRERIRQIEDRAIRKLKGKFVKSGITSDML